MLKQSQLRQAAKAEREVMFARAGYSASVPFYAAFATDKSLPIAEVRRRVLCCILWHDNGLLPWSLAQQHALTASFAEITTYVTYQEKN